MANISVVASVSSYVVTAGVALMALDLLQPAPRRRLVVNQPALVCMTLLSVFVLLVWAARAGLLPEQAHTLVYVHQVLLAGALITAFFALLPPSQPLRLGNLLVKQGDLDGAAAAYRRVLDAGRGSRIRAAVGRGETQSAEFGLGGGFLKQDDPEWAAEWFGRASRSRSPALVAAANWNLGLVLERSGDCAGARAAYERVGAIRGAREAGRAMSRLGDLLARQGDIDGAKAAYRRAIARGSPDVREDAARSLAELEDSQAER